MSFMVFTIRMDLRSATSLRSVLSASLVLSLRSAWKSETIASKILDTAAEKDWDFPIVIHICKLRLVVGEHQPPLLGTQDPTHLDFSQAIFQVPVIELRQSSIQNLNNPEHRFDGGLRVRRGVLKGPAHLFPVSL